MNPTEEKWMKKNFPHLSNAICAIYLDKHPRTVARMARELGLTKSEEYMESSRAAAIKKASKSNSTRLKGVYSTNLQKWNNRNKTI